MKTQKTALHYSILINTLAAVVCLLPATSACAQSSMTWSISADGIKEVSAGGVPSQGDPDGSALGFLTLTNGTGGNSGVAVISLTLSGIGPVGDSYTLGGWHIHNAASTTTGPIVLDFGSINTYLSGNTVSATIGGLSTATIDNVFANSANFYLNIHSSGAPYPGGAIRDQLTSVVPEPSSLAFAAIGLMGFGIARRKQ